MTNQFQEGLSNEVSDEVAWAAYPRSLQALSHLCLCLHVRLENLLALGLPATSRTTALPSCTSPAQASAHHYGKPLMEGLWNQDLWLKIQWLWGLLWEAIRWSFSLAASPHFLVVLGLLRLTVHKSIIFQWPSSLHTGGSNPNCWGHCSGGLCRPNQPPPKNITSMLMSSVPKKWMLPPQWPYDFSVDLISGIPVPVEQLYSL